MAGTCDSSPEKHTTDDLSVLSSDMVSDDIIYSRGVLNPLSNHNEHPGQTMSTISMIESGKKVKLSPATLFMWSISQVMFMLHYSF